MKEKKVSLNLLEKTRMVVSKIIKTLLDLLIGTFGVKMLIPIHLFQSQAKMQSRPFTKINQIQLASELMTNTQL